MADKIKKISRIIKKVTIIVLICILCVSEAQILSPYFLCEKVIAAENEGPEITSPSAILMEASTQRIIYEKNPDEVLPPASITKIMTLILIFEAVESGDISLSDEVTVSEHAASMGGSQVYLEVGEKQSVETLIKCISIASANDACVAMAEYVCGTEEQFVQKMNEKAESLNMSNTHFVNCCGLDADGHVSSARDIAVMSSELINNHPKIFDYTTVWMDTITHETKRGSSEFGLTNTNKLIKQYAYATGLKTGSTSKAKCCLSATANKDGIELIAVVMVAPDSKTRFRDAIILLNYGFGACKIYKDEPETPDGITVKGGKKDCLSVKYEKAFSYMFLENYDESEITKEPEINMQLTAPVKEGDVVGKLKYNYKGETLGEINLIAAETVEKSTFSDELKDIISRICFMQKNK